LPIFDLQLVFGPGRIVVALVVVALVVVAFVVVAFVVAFVVFGLVVGPVDSQEHR